jgi:hypothetical protein
MKNTAAVKRILNNSILFLLLISSGLASGSIVDFKTVATKDIPIRDKLTLKCNKDSWEFDGKNITPDDIKALINNKKYKVVYCVLDKDCFVQEAQINSLAKECLGLNKKIFIQRLRGSLDSLEWCSQYVLVPKSEKSGSGSKP